MSRFFGKPVHTAYVVPDLEATIARYLASGLGPAFTLRRLNIPGRYRGEDHSPVFSAAFVVTGEVAFEVLEQHDDTPSAYTEFLARNPAGGLHHVAYLSTDFGADIEKAKAGGVEYRIVQEFLTPDGAPFEIYMEPVGVSDPLLVQLMYGGPSEGVFRNIEAIAATWDGSDPVRDMFKMMPPEIQLPVAP